MFDEQAPISNWCSHKDTKWDRNIKHICRHGYAKLTESLVGSILERTKKEHFFSAPGRVAAFTVPKEEEKLRLIANCIELNKLFNKPPRLLFATMSELFMILSFFKESDTFFSVADFRHWFYQLALPKGKRRFFTLLSGGQTYQFKAWLMGFSWSPFVAQAHSMAIAKVGVDRCKYLHAISPLADQNALPPFWLVRDTIEKMERSDITAFVIFWYDNLLIVANRKKCQRRNSNQHKSRVFGSGGKMESIFQGQRKKLYIRGRRVHHFHEQSRIPRFMHHY